MKHDKGIPTDWKRVALGELAAVVMGTSPPGDEIHETPVGVPFLQGNAEFGTRFPTAAYHCSAPERMAKPNDVLMSVRAPVGELNVADQEYCIGRGLAAIRFGESDRAYGWYALKHGRLQLRRVSQGSTFDAIGKEDLTQFTLLLPPDFERQKIGEVLMAVDEAIEQTQAVINQTRRLKTALLQDLLAHGLPGKHEEHRRVPWWGCVPKDWSVLPLGKVLAEPVRNGYSPVCPSEPTGAWVLTLAAVSADGFNAEGVKPAPRNDARVADTYLIDGDIVLSRSNTRELVGLAGVYNGEPAKCGYSDLLMRIRPKKDRLPIDWLIIQLLAQPARAYFMRTARGTSGSMKKIDREILCELPILLPSPDERDRIVEILQAADRNWRISVSRLTQLIESKTALCQALLTGRVRVKAGGAK